MAGNANSGRYPAGSTLLNRPRMKSPDGQSFRISRRLNGAILAQVEEAFHNGEKLSTAYLDHIRWNIERVEGKPTVRLDADVHTTIGPDEYMKALQQAQGKVIDTPYSLITSHNIQSTPSPSCVLPDWEEECRVGEPVRTVSPPRELQIENESELYINGEGI